MMYHIERTGGDVSPTVEIWGGTPERCVAILPADGDRWQLAERLAAMMCREANAAETQAMLGNRRGGYHG